MEMKAFLEQGGWGGQFIGNDVIQISPALWVRHPLHFDFADAMLGFQEVLDHADASVLEQDMLVLPRLELGACFVIHATRLEVPMSMRYQTSPAELSRCGCGRYTVVCNSPIVDLECRH